MLPMAKQKNKIVKSELFFSLSKEKTPFKGFSFSSSNDHLPDETHFGIGLHIRYSWWSVMTLSVSVGTLNPTKDFLEDPYS